MCSPSGPSFRVLGWKLNFMSFLYFLNSCFIIIGIFSFFFPPCIQTITYCYLPLFCVSFVPSFFHFKDWSKKCIVWNYIYVCQYSIFRKRFSVDSCSLSFDAWSSLFIYSYSVTSIINMPVNSESTTKWPTNQLTTNSIRKIWVVNPFQRGGRLWLTTEPITLHLCCGL